MWQTPIKAILLLLAAGLPLVCPAADAHFTECNQIALTIHADKTLPMESDKAKAMEKHLPKCGDVEGYHVRIVENYLNVRYMIQKKKHN